MGVCFAILVICLESLSFGQVNAKLSSVPSISMWGKTLNPRFLATLDSLGDRMARPGKERLILQGTLTRQTGSKKAVSTFQIAWEFPGLLRLDEGAANRIRTIIYDGTVVWTSISPVTDSDVDLVETFAYDSAEYLLISQIQGAYTKFLREDTIQGTKGKRSQDPTYEIHQLFNAIPISHPFVR